MFGNPEWFRTASNRWGVAPQSWRGWLFVAIGALVMVVPSLALLGQQLMIEAALWLVAALGMARWEAWKLAAALRPETPADDVLYIDDEGTATDQLATRHFNFRVR